MIRTWSWAEAEREVILAAGAFDSPKLLMLSGIGPAEALAARGIRPVADLPGVGRHLQDHLLLPVFFTSRRSLPAPGFIAEAGLFVHSAPSTASATPDLQFHFSAGIPAFVPPDYRIDGPHFVFVPILVGPTSEGRVSLRSADPLDAPVIDPNYLHVDDDVEVLCRGIELSRRLARTKAFAEFTGVEVAPGEKCTPQELRQYVRTHCSTVWHVAGTCKMGRDPQAVVDSHLRVHGINGLRVADASVMPTITSGNTNAACVMIGEKAADLILASGVYEVGAAVAAHAGGGSR